MMKPVVPAGSPLAELFASRPGAFRRSFFHSVWFWLLLFAAIGFLINTVYLVVQGAVFYGMIGVTSSQIAYDYNVSETQVRHLLVSSVKPIPYKMIGYSTAVTLLAFWGAFMSRKLYRRARYIVKLEEAAAREAVKPPPGDIPGQEATPGPQTGQ